MPKLDVRPGLIFIIYQSVRAHNISLGAQMPRGGWVNSLTITTSRYKPVPRWFFRLQRAHYKVVWTKTLILQRNATDTWEGFMNAVKICTTLRRGMRMRNRQLVPWKRWWGSGSRITPGRLYVCNVDDYRTVSSMIYAPITSFSSASAQRSIFNVKLHNGLHYFPSCRIILKVEGDLRILWF
jgi:hypothetical protein